MPKEYIPRPRPLPWTAMQKDLLVRLVEANRPWPEISQRCGHTKASCQTMMSYIRNGRKRDGGELVTVTRPPVPPIFISPQVAPAAVPTGRHRRTSTLIVDAELRARIETLGPTGGLCGDPMPGRSALDKMRAGVRDDPRAPSLAGGVSA